MITMYIRVIEFYADFSIFQLTSHFIVIQEQIRITSNLNNLGKEANQ
jgi:hypothetical protein